MEKFPFLKLRNQVRVVAQAFLPNSKSFVIIDLEFESIIIIFIINEKPIFLRTNLACLFESTSIKSINRKMKVELAKRSLIINRDGPDLDIFYI